jgi:YVTN family beta-propeller protein
MIRDMRRWSRSLSGSRQRAVQGLAGVAVLACGSLSGWAPVASAQGAIPGHTAPAASSARTVAEAASATRGTAWQVYVPSDPAGYGPGVVPVINTATNGVTTTITAGDNPASVAITPDATEAYVVNMFSGDVSVIDLATNRVVATVKVGCFPVGVAIAPNGRKAYVANDCSHDVSVINTRTNKLAGTVRNAGPEPEYVDITPNGAKAYVVGPETADVRVINTATGKVTGLAQTSSHYSLVTSAMSPDGKFLYVGNACCQVFVISTATDKVVDTIRTNGPTSGLDSLAISPDGTKLYALTSYNFAPRSSISVIDTATSKVTGHISLPHYAGNFPGLFFTPDGKFAYVTLQDHSVGVIDTSTGTVIQTVSIRGVPQGPAVTPDQAPVARMTVTPAPVGHRTRFDASASTVRYGTIASYAWNFGDGTTATTRTPVMTHVYTAPGRYTVKLTETSSAGTSTTKVFTGETMSRNGGPSAVTAATAVIRAPAGPSHRPD